MDDFWYNRKINSIVAIALIAVLSSLVAWYTIKEANEILITAPDNPAFNIQKRGADLPR